jgi:hypothetical protein
MDERKIADSTNSDALFHLRAHRALLARRINEIAVRIVDLRTALETLDQEMKAKVDQLAEVDRGIRALGFDKPSARRVGRWADMNRDSPTFSGDFRNEEEGHR